jgi:hypothetical protein
MVGDRLAGPDAAAERPFLTVAHPDGFDNAAEEEGVEGDAAAGVEIVTGLGVGQGAVRAGLVPPVAM